VVYLLAGVVGNMILSRPLNLGRLIHFKGRLKRFLIPPGHHGHFPRILSEKNASDSLLRPARHEVEGKVQALLIE